MKNFSFVNFVNVTILGTSASGFLCLSLLDASIKSLVLLVLSAIACLILVRASAASRHLVWAATMTGLLLMPACALGLPQWRVLPSWLSLENRLVQLPMANQSVAINQAVNHVISELQPSLPREQMAEVGEFARPIEPPPVVATKEFVPIPIRLNAVILLGIWGAGCAVCLIPMAMAFLRLQQIEIAFANKNALPPRIDRRITKFAEEMHMKIPRIFIGPAGAMPMVWSFGSSRLFLPADIESWSPMRLNAVLLHELVHLKRRDPTWFLVAQMARAVNWFNPLAWYAVQRLRIECERACDDHVLRMGIDASEYAGHLLALSTSVRTESGTASLALAMANKPSVENRIISILDERMNRHGVTLRRAMVTLVVVSIGVAILATLAATAGDKNNSIANEGEEPIKYPYCIVAVDNLKPRSLADAIMDFNKESQESPTGVLQSPITEQETLAAILKFVELDHVPGPTKATLREIAKSKTLPANAYFRRYTRFDDEQQMHGVWWVRLYIEGSTPPVYSVPIRTVSIFDRPYTQLERKQNVEGITLINRFTSFFEESPTIAMKEEFRQDAVDRLKNAFRTAIYAKDLDGTKELFHWQGVNDSTRDFATSELQMLFEASALSIKIEPSTLSGKLIHWSAYHHYEPNLPVVGFMHIEYTPHDPSTIAQKPTGSYLLDKGDILGVYVEGVLPYKTVSGATANNSFPDGGSSAADPPLGFPIVVQENGTMALPFPKRVLSLELGKFGNEFRLVNYVAVGERKLPEGNVGGISIRGNMETLADGTYLMASVITNPDSLISAHLANEEIHQRGLGHKQNANMSQSLGERRVRFTLVGKMDTDGDGTDDRDAIASMITELGGQVTDELTAETRWLVIGEVNSADNDGWLIQSKAKSLGISQIKLEKLMRWLGLNDTPPKLKSSENDSPESVKGWPTPRFQTSSHRAIPQSDSKALALAMQVQERAAAINSLSRIYYKATHSSGIVATVKPDEWKTSETIEAFRKALLKAFSVRFYSHRATIAFDEKRGLYATEMADQLYCRSFDRHDCWALNTSRYEVPKLVRLDLHDSNLPKIQILEFAYLVQVPRTFWWGELVNANPTVSQIDPKKVTWILLDPQEFADELCDVVESPQRGERLWIGRTSGHLRGVLSFDNELIDWPANFENADSVRRIAGRTFSSHGQYLDWVSKIATSDQKRGLGRATQAFATTGFSEHTPLNHLIQFDDYREVQPGIWIPYRELSSTKRSNDYWTTNVLPIRRTYPETSGLEQYFSKAELIVEEVRFDMDVDAEWEMLKSKPR